MFRVSTENCDLMDPLLNVYTNYRTSLNMIIITAFCNTMLTTF